MDNSKDVDYAKKFEQEIYDMFEAQMFNNKAMVQILDNVRTRIVNSNLRGN